jgi:hypothetical protein
MASFNDARLAVQVARCALQQPAGHHALLLIDANLYQQQRRARRTQYIAVIVALCDCALERADGRRSKTGAYGGPAPLFDVVRRERRQRIRRRVGLASRHPVVAIARRARLGYASGWVSRCPGRRLGTVVDAEAIAVAGVGAHRIAHAHFGQRAAGQTDDALQRVVHHHGARP